MRHRSARSATDVQESKGIPALADDLEKQDSGCDIPWSKNTATTADSGKHGHRDSSAYTERIQRDSTDNPENRQWFFDEENFEAFDKLDILFIGTGKMFSGIKDTSPDKRARGNGMITGIRMGLSGVRLSM